MRANNLGRPIELLLVEDNLDDAEFTQVALEEVKVLNQLHHVWNGEEAITFLRDPSKPRPDLILLDLNMPRMDGRETLKIIKHDESLKSIPVIILTTSDMEIDIHQAYQNYTNCYLRKPVEFSNFVQLLSQLNNFWLQIVELSSTS